MEVVTATVPIAIAFLSGNPWFIGIMNAMGILGILLAVIDMALSVWLAVNIRNIRFRQNLLTGRVREIVEELSEHASRISRYLSDFDRMHPQIQSTLVEVEAQLDSLLRQLGRKQNELVNELLAEVRAYTRGKKADRERVDDMYLGVQRVVSHVQALQKDARWEI